MSDRCEATVMVADPAVPDTDRPMPCGKDAVKTVEVEDERGYPIEVEVCNRHHQELKECDTARSS